MHALIRLLVVACTMAGSLVLAQQIPEAIQDGLPIHRLRLWLRDMPQVPGQDTEAPASEAGIPAGAQEAIPSPDEQKAPVSAEFAEVSVPEIIIADASASISIPFFEHNGPDRASPVLDTRDAGLPVPASGNNGGEGPDSIHEVPTIPLPVPEERSVPTPVPAEAPQQPPVPARPSGQLLRTDKRVQTLLLMGSDKRDDDSTWRTDTIMIVVMDYRANQADIISIPRDLFIEDPPAHGPNKINTFDYWGERAKPGGGAELMKQIVHDYFGIPIDLYARVQFSSFAQIVDVLDGIEVYVPCHLYDIIPEENIYLNLQPGYHTLDGDQALDYVRSRAQGGDLSRVERQQQVLLALKHKLTLRNLAPQIPRLYKTLISAVDTDVSLLDAINLARFGYNVKFDNIRLLTLGPPDHMETGWAYGMQVWLPDWERIREDIRIMLEHQAHQETTGTSASQVQVQAAANERCQ